MSKPSRRNNPKVKRQVTLQLICAAMTAYMLSAIIHEMIGHGGTCLLLGGRITLLSSVYFRSHPHFFRVDAAGPLANLVAGLGLWLYLRKPNSAQGGILGLVLLFTMVFNLAWFAATLLASGVIYTGDWSFAMANPTVETVWRVGLILLGIAAYHFLVRPAFLSTWRHTLLYGYGRIFSATQLLLIPYLGAGISASLAASWFGGGSWPATLEGSGEILGAALPWLLLIRRVDQVRSSSPVKPLDTGRRTSYLFYILVGLSYLLFSLVLGHGLFFN